MNINFIGAGRLGRSLGWLFTQNKIATVAFVFSQTLHRAQEASDFIGAGKAVDKLMDLQPADITFITTPDQHIESVCDDLVILQKIKPHAIVVHCSGIKTSDVLARAKQQGCSIASFHPLKSFADPILSVHSFAGTYCSVEGDGHAITELTTLFHPLGAKIIPLDQQKKALYHAGAVFASNYVLTLFNAAQRCLQEAAIDPVVAQAIIHSLMQSTLDNAKQLRSASRALTGPLKRADTETLRQHDEALRAYSPDLRNLYKILAQQTVDITHHNTNVKKDLNHLLDTLGDS